MKGEPENILALEYITLRVVAKVTNEKQPETSSIFEMKLPSSVNRIVFYY